MYSGVEIFDQHPFRDGGKTLFFICKSHTALLESRKSGSTVCSPRFAAFSAPALEYRIVPLAGRQRKLDRRAAGADFGLPIRSL
jgi:hypothetical protein